MRRIRGRSATRGSSKLVADESPPDPLEVSSSPELPDIESFPDGTAPATPTPTPIP
jgi:hypothetical protein